MRPCELFRYADTCFAYHLGLGKCLAVSTDAFAYLTLRQSLSRPEAERTFRTERPDASRTLAEVAQLEDAGFFDPVETAFADDRTFDAALERHYAASWSRLELSVSERCNLACRYCYCGTCRDEVPNGGLMSVETARRAIEWLFAHSGRDDVTLTFFGGEPLLNKDVLKASVALCDRLAAERGVRAEYVMTTNATLLDDETVDLIRSHDFGLMVSLDGPRELHDAQCPTRDGRGSWDAAVAGIRRLMAKRRRLTVRCTMAHPVPDELKLVRFFDDFGFSRIVLGPVENPLFPSVCDFTDDDRREEARQRETAIIPWMLAECAAGREPKYNPFEDLEADLRRPDAPEPSPFRCGACHGTTTVGADGALYPCHRFVGMKDWTVGTLADGPDLERCKQFWRDYRAAVQGACSRCWAYRLCGGPCPWSMAKKDGSFALDERFCENTKRWIRQGAWYLDLKRKQQKGTKPCSPEETCSPQSPSAR